jgi:hypothetical protein
MFAAIANFWPLRRAGDVPVICPLFWPHGSWSTRVNVRLAVALRGP